MTDITLWNDDQLAQFLGYKSKRSIQRLNSRGEGPPFIKRGNSKRYRPQAVQEWLLSQEQSQPRAGALAIKQRGAK